MKKKIIVLALIVTLLSGCGGKIPTLSNGDEAVVTLKDGSMISVNELYDSVKNDYALTALVNLVDKKILEETYKDNLEEAEENADSTMTQLESYYGDNLLSLIQQQTGFQSLEAYRNYVYISYLRNLAIQDYSEDQITEKQIEKYYEDEIVGDIKVSHILITPDVTDDMTDEEKEEAENEAKEKAEALIDELNKTDEKDIADKFAELAKEQSQDETTKDNGGSLGFINKTTLSDDYDELVDAAYKLKDGKYSSKVVTTELGYHIILRTESKEKASLDEVRDQILEELGTEYLSKNQVAAVEALREIRKENDFEIVDSELKSQYATYIQNELAYYQQLQEQSTTTE
ncbi:MAG TPA: peptidylprolyl isomerase [Candidatus Coprovivens excrementavium]|nr:peptidylprolyl isomerase [Candidatus Coprovivens excrementavium]